MNILVTGANGQLGNELRRVEHLHPARNFIFTDINELDITNPVSIDQFIASHKINFIVNCAAYTAVDKAETDQTTAFRINAEAPGWLAASAQKHGCTLIHISTDYVFNGKGYKPYVEIDETWPESYYGKSKLAGEQAVLNNTTHGIIIRTSWLYSEFGANFIKTMRKYGAERGKLSVVFDQIGSPTWAADLAHAIMAIVNDPLVEKKTGIYHYANEGVTSWYDFAVEILRLSEIQCIVTPIETKDYPLPAPRPHYSVMNKSLIKHTFSIQIPHWKNSLEQCIARLNEQN